MAGGVRESDRLCGTVNLSFIGRQPIHAKNDVDVRVSKKYEASKKQVTSDLDFVATTYFGCCHADSG